MKKILSMLIASLIVGTALAQKATVTGLVTDTNGKPIVGATVIDTLAKRGATTNPEGKYTLSGTSEKGVLCFSFLGMKPVYATVGKRTVIDVTLEIAESEIDEVVVVGYGTVRKSDLTGAVSVVKMDNVGEIPAMSALEAMQGKVSGVNIITNTGEPGAGMTFQVRGATSITGNNQPLIVLDGQPINTGFESTSAGANIDWMAERPSTDPMANINPADIESIQILKDASSTAIYGSAGANGVVLITTKSGREGRSVITYSGRIDVGVIPKFLDVASTEEYYTMIYEAQNWDRSETKRFSSMDDVRAQAALQHNTDWQDLTYQTAISHDHQISLSGGDKKTTYMLSGNYADQNSIVKGGSYTRGGLRVNLKREITSRLTASARTFMSMARKNQMPQANSQGNLSTSIVLAALAFKPESVPYNEDGDLDEGLTNNPVVMRETIQDQTDIRTIVSNISLQYQLCKGLTFSINGGVNSVYTRKHFYWPRTLYQGKMNDGSGTRSDNDNFSYVVDYLLTFNRRFNKHNVNVVAGYSWQEWTNSYSSQTSTGFPSDALGYYGFSSATYPQKMYNGYTRRRMASFIARANYSYDDRYVFMFTGRIDGSSRLAVGHKWGAFPSVGLAWNAHNEKFLAPAKQVLTNLKLRASYGISGNENVAIGATQSKISYNGVVFGDNSISQGYVVGNFDNPYLTWETTRQLNVGLDLGLWNRVNLSAEFYQKNTTDLLLNVKLPGSSSFTSYSSNTGEVRNRGLDFEAAFRVLTGKVKLNIAGNISVVRNKILSMGDAGVIYGRSYCNNGQFSLNQPIHIAQAGYPIGMFIGYKTEGIYQNEREIQEHTYTDPKTGVTNVIPQGAKPGDIRWADTNNDGIISEADRTVIGSPYPDFTYGINLDCSYKGLTLAMTFVGSQGNSLVNFNKWVMSGLSTKTNVNIFKEAFDHRWTGEGTSNKYPRPHTGDVFSSRFPDWMVEDASYFRLQNVTLSYMLPQRIVKAMRLGKIKVFVTGTNLFTVTDYSGYDPAINSFGDTALQPGVDFGTLPAPRVVSAGVELTF